MERTIYGFIFRYSKREQVFILFFTLLALPFYYVSLDIPKLIVNNVLSDPEPIAELSVPGLDASPAIVADERMMVLMGFNVVEIERLNLLAIYAGLFLLLVLINGGFKYFINVYKGLMGERMLRRLRYSLYSRIMRFPLPHFRRVSAGELIPMVTQEVEPLGGFIGDALALPMFQGGLLITALIFIFMQDVWMGLAAISLYPMQGWIIPKLQRKVNLLGKARVREVRKISERIAETVQGAEEMHANGMARWEMAEFTSRMGRVFEIRFEIYRKKFFIKFLNNFLAQLTPFFFYAIGGYFVIDGALSLGGLVAVLAAYKDLPPPWKELLNHYQIREDSKIKYDQVVTQFAPAGMREDEVVSGDAEVGPFQGELSAVNVKYEEDGDTLIDGFSFEMALDSHVALVGDASSGKDRAALLLARLIDNSGGKLSFGGIESEILPEAVSGRRIGFVGASTALFSASLMNNLLYGLRQTPQGPRVFTNDEERRKQDRIQAESVKTANSPDDVGADWVDLAQAGAEGVGGLIAAVRNALSIADMEEDVYQLGLRGRLDPETRPQAAEHLLEARSMLEKRLAEDSYKGLVEPFERTAYNSNATVGENLLFGTPVGDAFDLERLPENEYVMKVLGEIDLIEDFLKIGHEVAQTMVELFADLPPDHEYFSQFSFISLDDLPDYQANLRKVDRDGLEGLEEEERRLLLALPFKLAPARHRLGLLDGTIQARILEARQSFAEGLPEELAGAVEFFDRDRYNAASSLQDNILFGKLSYGRAQAQAKIGDLISEVIESLNLRSDVVEVGLDFEVGIGGSRLSPAQRQKTAIARSILKRPQVMVMAEATAALDGSTQTTILNKVREEFRGRALIWAMHRPSQAEGFDQVVVMKGGKVAEKGSYEELMAKQSTLPDLVAAE
ncbi:MAG: ABC transporter ATP-binding protein [Rhodospirillaceae bacterium]|nr:ABC transporter ATP-binding protein [Rhodospirillaceae bacterium]